MSLPQLTCIHRKQRLEEVGTSETGNRIPLHHCEKFDAPCSTAVKTVEGHRLCKGNTCREPPPGEKVSSAGKPRMSFSGMAEKKSKCAELKAAGLPCTEFSNTVTIPEPPPISER